jgi:hypothetical protein
MRIVLAFLLGLALAGTASAKPIDSDPVTLITGIYKTYETPREDAGLVADGDCYRRLLCQRKSGPQEET